MDKLYKEALYHMECGNLRVVVDYFDYDLKGFIIESNDQILIVINANLPIETQISKIYHEIRHLKHLRSNKSVEECESEADEYEKAMHI